jgi:hypothetical protein
MGDASVSGVETGSIVVVFAEDGLICGRAEIGRRVGEWLICIRGNADRHQPRLVNGWAQTIGRLGQLYGTDKDNAGRLEGKAAEPKSANSKQRDGSTARTGEKGWGVIIGGDDLGMRGPSLAPKTAWWIVNLSDWVSSS